LGRLLDGRQVGEVELLILKKALGIRPSTLDVGFGPSGLFFRASRDIYLGVFGVKNLGNLFPDTSIGASDDVYLWFCDGPYPKTTSPV